MRKKLTALLLALTLALTLTACGASGGKDASSSSGTGAGSVSSGAVSGSGSASGEEPDSLPADDSTSAQPEKEPEKQPESTPVTKPSTTKPSTTKPSGGSSAQKVDLSAFYTTLSSGDDFPSMTAVSGDALDTLYPGLNDLKPSQCLVYTAAISAVACEVALVEVSGSAAVKSVKDIFQARVDYQIDQGAFYPSTVEAWQKDTQIVANGNYVMLICYSGADTAVSSFNALFR
ncbi:MAG: DUF4358 domain-containing protein [Oscillibacter sp.]|jgi:hypothetical protein|nr:DUF4358 domain-containing protein [Oscillibacter sp.]